MSPADANKRLPRQQFETLALAQLDTLFRVARRLTHDPTSAQDLVQETYLRALRGAGGFRLESYGIRPWLLRIMRNVYASRYEHEKRQPRSVDDQTLEAAATSEPVWAGLPLFEGMDQRLKTALERLPDEYQQVMLLWAVEELSYKEIADVMDIPIGTVMSRLHRARQRLAEQLQEFAAQQGIVRE